MSELWGLGVSPGLAIGPVRRMGHPPVLPPPRAVGDVAAEGSLAAAALKAVEADLLARAEAARNQVAREVLGAQAMIAADPVLLHGVTERIRSGTDAAHALRAALDEHRELLEAAGGYLAERAADLRDIADRAVAAALGEPMPGLPMADRPFVLVAVDLAPADTAGLDPEQVMALVTERGGPTGHTAILARSLGIPAVVGCRGASRLVDGDLTAVDGDTGQVRYGPSAELRSSDQPANPQSSDLQASGRQASGRDASDPEAERPHPALATPAGSRTASGASVTFRASGERAERGPARTADGHPVELLLNIGSAADLAGVDPSGVAGVGLFRTEFLFLGRRTEPGFDEQVAAYTKVFAAFDPRRQEEYGQGGAAAGGGRGHVVVRTLDGGADKPLPFLRLPEEPNPALGVRGFRTSRDRPEVLDVQLRAIAAAASGVGTDVWVMAPMISTPREAAEFVDKAHGHGLTTAGVMIEVPAAALRADRFLAVADFLSIGTNDLAQYLLATDRQCGDLPDLLDPWQPTVLGLIKRCAEAGAATGRPVSICGEAAADPALTPVLAGLGITRLSLAPRGLAAVRTSLGKFTLAECRHMAERALNADDAVEARAAVTAGRAPLGAPRLSADRPSRRASAWDGRH